LYKNYLKTELPAYITGSTLYISNDISFKPLEKDADGVVAIINGGVGSRAMVDGGDYITLNFAINFICDSNKAQTIIANLQSFMNVENAKYGTLSIYDYRATFSNPYIVGDLFEIMSKNEDNKTISLKCVNIALNVSLQYSSTVYFKPDTWKITIASTEYTILGIDSYDFASVPTYEPAQINGSTVITQHKAADVRTFHFKLMALKSNALHTLLMGEYTSATSISSNAILKLKRNSETAVDIQTINVTETWNQGVKYIDLTLGR
jgi:hypothetical protein